MVLFHSQTRRHMINLNSVWVARHLRFILTMPWADLMSMFVAFSGLFHLTLRNVDLILT